MLGTLQEALHDLATVAKTLERTLTDAPPSGLPALTIAQGLVETDKLGRRLDKLAAKLSKGSAPVAKG